MFEDEIKSLKRMGVRAVLLQIMNFAMVISTGLMVWKGMGLVTNTESPIVVVLSGGMLIPIALRAIGFGTKGPIKNTIAAAVQRVINPVQLGSVFSRFQSAAMHGAALKELQSFVHIVISGLVGAGIAGLIEAGIKPHDHSIHQQEWRNWVSESMIYPSTDVTNNSTQLWGAYRSSGCMAYGYHEVRAPLASVPEGMDPLTVCKQTPALIYDMGFVTPLGCVDEGPKKGVVGLWYVPTNATQCMPKWSKFEDEGCMLYGRRRRFARLMGLKMNGDWKGVCESTPAIIDDKVYDRPSHCDDKGVGGIYGVFDIVDEKCECSCIRT
ncbi:hypothetical protein RSOLAG22IIIB_05983 [Rhizoctonia solani]|uniref:Uncharacterized protein n=1 Tax=Rhizoctonia solani TaxID=456999 RepID=A0A0K6GAG5_9AGAM|nr:hypothetical protein RSOLAG22IIIB_05983 [Rhizoctonia solani]